MQNNISFPAKFCNKPTIKGTFNIVNDQITFNNQQGVQVFNLEIASVMAIRKRTLISTIFFVIFFPLIVLFFLIMIVDAFQGNANTYRNSRNFYIIDQAGKRYHFKTRNRNKVIKTLSKNLKITG